MKKRISALCAALALILSLAACGTGDHDTPIPDYDEPSAGVPAGPTTPGEPTPTEALPEGPTNAEWLAKAAALDESNALQSGKIGDRYSWYYDGEVLTVRGTGTLFEGEAEAGYYGYDNVARVLWDLGENSPAAVVVEDGCIAMWGAFGGTGAERLTNIVIADGVMALAHSTFCGCTKLKQLTLPQSVIIVGENVFKECESLAELTMPDDLIFMSGKAFYGCDCLHQIHWRGETYSSPDAFLEAVKAAGIPTEGDAPTFDAITGVLDDIHIRLEGDTLYFSGQGTIRQSDVGKASAEHLVIEPGITGIDNKAFEGLGHVSVTLPDGLKSIRDGAFARNWKLTSITLPDGLEVLGERAFEGCRSLAEITIPGSVEHIKSNAFSDCESLTSVTLSPGVKSIGDYAFSGISDCPIASLTLPDTLESIGGFAFDSPNLTAVVIPDSVTSMGECAFVCENLTEATIGSSLTQFDGTWFQGCWNLAKIKAPSSMQEDVLKSGMDTSIFEWY